MTTNWIDLTSEIEFNVYPVTFFGAKVLFRYKKRPEIEGYYDFDYWGEKGYVKKCERILAHTKLAVDDPAAYEKMLLDGFDD
jgi:hypothetical protein